MKKAAKKKVARNKKTKKIADIFPDKFVIKNIHLIESFSKRFNDHREMPANTELSLNLRSESDKENHRLSVFLTYSIKMFGKGSDHPFFISQAGYHLLCVPRGKAFPRFTEDNVKDSAPYLSKEAWPYAREHLSLSMAQLRAPLLDLPVNWGAIQSQFDKNHTSKKTDSSK